MKKKLATLAFLYLPFWLSAQINYHHYLDSSYVWFERTTAVIFGGQPCTFGGDDEIYYRYHIIGTEFLDGYEWYQIHRDWVENTYCLNGGTYQHVSGISGVAFHIREDSQHRIFMRTSNSMRMMYDFGTGTAVGDTLRMYDYAVNFAVDSIDTVYLGNQPLRKYWVACNNSNLSSPHFVVEGVGGLAGFDNFYELCQVVFDVQNRFVCCERQGHRLVLDPNSDCGIPDHNPVLDVQEAATVAPKVVWNGRKRTLQLLGTSAAPIEWQVTSMLGNVIVQGVTQESLIALPDLPAGIYLFAADLASGRCLHRFFVD